MNSDDARRPHDAPYRQVGPGMQLNAQCWDCKKSKSRIGGKYRGRLKLFRCAQCVEAKGA